MYLFVYCLENLLKYEKQFKHLPVKNDFYQLRNASSIFDFCLIADKILEYKYEGKFRSLFPRKHPTIAGMIWCLFDDKGWIANIPHAGELKNKLNPKVLNLEPDKAVPLLLRMNVSLDGSPLSIQMAMMILVWLLRNWGGHRIKRQQVFVDSYFDIAKWLVWSIFIAVGTL